MQERNTTNKEELLSALQWTKNMRQGNGMTWITGHENMCTAWWWEVNRTVVGFSWIQYTIQNMCVQSEGRLRRLCMWRQKEVLKWPCVNGRMLKSKIQLSIGQTLDTACWNKSSKIHWCISVYVGMRLEEKDNDSTGKAQTQQTEFLVVCEAYKAIFWLNPSLKEKIVYSCDFQSRGSITSASTMPHRGTIDACKA